jgi:hypothetical protein
MKRLAIPIMAAAMLVAACGGAAKLSGASQQPASLAGNVQVNAGANAGSDVSDVNRTNPVVGKSGSSHLRPVPTAQPVAPASGQPTIRSGFDRCGTGIGNGLGGSSAGSGTGKMHPMLACMPE